MTLLFLVKETSRKFFSSFCNKKKLFYFITLQLKKNKIFFVVFWKKKRIFV